MAPLAEVCPTALGEVRRDLVATRDAVDTELRVLRWRAAELGVPTTDLDRVLSVADELRDRVVPAVTATVMAAEDLAATRYSGGFDEVLPMIERSPWVVSGPWPAASGPSVSDFTVSPLTGSTTEDRLSWDGLDDGAMAADDAATAGARSAGDWFEDRWDDAVGAVDDAAAWVGERVADAWDLATEAGARVADWWDHATATVGAWIDRELDDVREFLGRHVGLMRFAADAMRTVGWVVVGLGAVATVGLGIIGAMGGTALGAIFGLGLGAVPGGAGGALTGASIGLQITGAGFALVALGDLTDVAADWGEGTIDGQEVVQRGALELGLAATSLVGFGALGKLLQRGLRALPDQWRRRLDDWLSRTFARRAGEAEIVLPRDAGPVAVPPMARADQLYGKPRPDHGTFDLKYLPTEVHPTQQHLGGDLRHPWGRDLKTRRLLTKKEFEERYVTADGGIRRPPNDGAVPGTVVRYDHTTVNDFFEEYGYEVDRIGGEAGEFMGVPPGTPFGARSPPPHSLGSELHGYRFAGHLPEGLVVETGEVAPAFGQPGGGTQLRITDGENALPVEELLDRKVLRPWTS